jgi:hypothetical protein
MLPDFVYVLQFASLVVIEVLVVVLLVVLFKLLRKYQDLKAEQQRFKTEAQTKAEAIFTKAEKEAESLLNDARVKAQTLVAEAEGFSKEGSKRLQESLDWLLQSQTRTYTEQLEATRQETEKRLLKIADEINSQALTEIKVFANNLAQQTKASQEETQAVVKQAYSTLQEEVERYRQQRFAQVDEVVRSMVMKVTSEVMGKSLTSSDHEVLIIKALEEAKKKNMV